MRPFYSSSMTSLQGAREGAENDENAAESIAEHPVFENIARGGFVMSGIVHVLIGEIGRASCRERE